MMSASCLLKGRSLLHKPITARDTGETLGTVQDIVFDHDQNQVLAFLLDHRWRVEARTLPWSGIYAVRPDGVTAHNAAMITSGVNLLTVRRVFERESIRRGTRLTLRSGRVLGRVQDIYFTAYGVLEGYAVQGGGEQGDRLHFVPAPRAVWVEGSTAILPDDYLRSIEENAAARRRLPHALRLLARDIWNQADLGDHDPQSDTVPRALVRAVARAAVHLAEGLRATRAVMTRDGWYIVVRGQIVTARTLERARAHNQERALLMAVGVNPMHELLAVMRQQESSGSKRGS